MKRKPIAQTRVSDELARQVLEYDTLVEVLNWAAEKRGDGFHGIQET